MMHVVMFKMRRFCCSLACGYVEIAMGLLRFAGNVSELVLFGVRWFQLSLVVVW